MSSDKLATWESVLFSLLALLALYALIIALTRVAGLRSFTKMSSFDFVLTVATGSMIASAVVTQRPPILVALAAIAMVYVLQMGVAVLRQHSKRFQALVDNEPLVLMAGRDILEENMRKARVTHDDLRNKLRMQGVTNRDQVIAVVMETSGDVSVLKRNPKDDEPFEDWLVTQVRDADRLKVTEHPRTAGVGGERQGSPS